MPKKWQEIEFLDYKERQVRRRSLRSKDLQTKLEQGHRSTAGLKVVLVLSVSVVAVLCVLVFAQDHLRRLAGRFGGRTGLTVAQVSGEVELGTSSRASGAVQVGDRFDDELTVKQGDHGRLTLEAYWKPSRIVVQARSHVEISKVQLASDSPDKYRLKIKILQGTVMAEIRAGIPLVEFVLPQGCTAFGGLGMYKVIADDAQSQVIVREGVAAVRSADRSRTEQVAADQRIVMKKGDELSKAGRYATPESMWR